MRPSFSLAAGALIALTIRVPAQQPHAITFDDFSAVRAVSDPQPSPDGKLVLYAVRTTDVSANSRSGHTYVIPVAGGSPRAFPSAEISAAEARWSPDGKRIAYISGGQLWVADPSGSGRKQLTDLSGGATGPIWSPNGDQIAFTSAVYPECSNDACNTAKAKAAAESKVKAHVADELLYRHWNAWDEGTRSHLFIVGVEGGAPRDLVPGAKYDVPPGPFGGSEGYAWSPDERELAYTAKDQGRANAWSTDLNVYVVPAAGGASTVITASNKGADANPAYSPDGRFIAYASQARAGFESDRQRLMLYDRARRTSRELLPRWDRNADAYFWSPASKTIYVQTTDAGRDKLYRVGVSSSGEANTPQLAVGEHNNTAFAVSSDGRTIVWTRNATQFPAEVYAADVASTGAFAAHALTHENDALVAQLAVNPAEDFWFTGAAGAKVQGFIVKPPNWKPGRKYPGILLIHGGPQGAWLDGLRTEIRRRRIQGVGRKGLHRSDEWGRRGAGEESMDRFDGAGSSGRLIRRLHGQLDRRPLDTIQGAGVARGSVQSREHGDGHRRAVVPRLGIRRPVLGPESDGNAVSGVLAAPVREELQDADAGDRR